MEALLMRARKRNLPMQSDFFAFLRDVLGGANAYLDSFKETQLGQGQVFCVAYPVELADGADAAAQVYGSILHRVGLSFPFGSHLKLQREY